MFKISQNKIQEIIRVSKATYELDKNFKKLFKKFEKIKFIKR